jgi:hypothetical protein
VKEKSDRQFRFQSLLKKIGVGASGAEALNTGFIAALKVLRHGNRVFQLVFHRMTIARSLS